MHTSHTSHTSALELIKDIVTDIDGDAELSTVKDVLNDGEALAYYDVSDTALVEEADDIVRQWLKSGFATFSQTL